MELKLYSKDFEHIKENSSYNHNYYKNKNDETIIYEVCNENYDEYKFYLLDTDNSIDRYDLIFLGSSNQSFSFDEVINIDFRMIYT